MGRIGLLSWYLAASLAFFAREANAQVSAGMPFSIRPLVDLALKEPVLKELGIKNDAPVLAEMRKLSQTIRIELPQRLRNPRQEDASGSGRIKPNVQAEKIQAEYDDQLKKLITADQYTRLRQIHWQIAGVNALNDKEVINALAITKEQQENLATVQRETFRKRRQTLNSGPDIEEDRKKIGALISDWEIEVNKILSKTQQEKFAKLENREKMSFRDLNKAEVVKALDITKDQQDKLATLSQDVIEKQKKLFETLNGNRNRKVDEEAQKRMRELTAEQEKKTNDILTADQQSKFADLKGKPFDRESIGQ